MIRAAPRAARAEVDERAEAPVRGDGGAGPAWGRAARGRAGGVRPTPGKNRLPAPDGPAYCGSARRS